MTVYLALQWVKQESRNYSVIGVFSSEDKAIQACEVCKKIQDNGYIYDIEPFTMNVFVDENADTAYDSNDYTPLQKASRTYINKDNMEIE